MNNLDKKLSYKKEKSLENAGLPPSLDNFLSELLNKIDKIKEVRPFDSYVVYTKDLILDINRFLNNLREYKDCFERFERLKEEVSRGLEEKTEKVRYETLLKEYDFKRIILHDSIIKNFIRLIDTYNKTFEILSSLPVDSYFTEEKKEEFKKEKFPWGCHLILNESGKIQDKFYDKDGNIDLSYVSSEDREIFSEWALKLSEELCKVDTYKNKIEAKEIEESDELANLMLSLKLLEEEKQKIDKIKDRI